MLARATLALLAALFFGGAAWAQSQPPSPPRHTDEFDQAPNADQRGTLQRPLVVEIAPAPEGSPQAKKETEHEHEKTEIERSLKDATWAIAGVTLVLAIGTGVLAAYTFKLWRATRTLVKDAKDTAERQLRAYPGVVGAAIVIDANKVSVRFEIKNLSTTPAYKFQHAIEHDFVRAPEPAQWKEISFNDMQWDMAPHSRTTMRTSGDISDRQIAALKMGDLALIICGRVAYEDAFEKPRHIEFVYRSGDFKRDAWVVMPSTGAKIPREIWVCTEPEPISYKSN